MPGPTEPRNRNAPYPLSQKPSLASKETHNRRNAPPGREFSHVLSDAAPCAFRIKRKSVMTQKWRTVPDELRKNANSRKSGETSRSVAFPHNQTKGETDTLTQTMTERHLFTFASINLQLSMPPVDEHLHYCAVYPPSMECTLPVIKAARSLNRNATKSATSSRAARRFMGCWFAIQSVTSWPDSIIRGVAT